MYFSTLLQLPILVEGPEKHTKIFRRQKWVNQFLVQLSVPFFSCAVVFWTDVAKVISIDRAEGEPSSRKSLINSVRGRKEVTT